MYGEYNIKTFMKKNQLKTIKMQKNMKKNHKQY